MIRTFFATGLIFALLWGPAAAAEFVLDKPHTQAEFIVTHLALSRVHGQIPLVSGTATIGSDNLPTAITATFDVTKLFTNNDARDANLRDDYFEASKYPTITFVERGIQGTPAAFKMTGDLTIHGVTKSVTLDGSVDGTAVIKGKKNVAYTATATLDRRDFGMTFGPVLNGSLIAGDEVTINIETDAVEQ